MQLQSFTQLQRFAALKGKSILAHAPPTSLNPKLKPNHDISLSRCRRLFFVIPRDLLLPILAVEVISFTTSPFHVVILSAAKDPVFAVAFAFVLVAVVSNRKEQGRQRTALIL